MGGIGSVRRSAKPQKQFMEDYPCVSMKELREHDVFASGEKAEWNQKPSGGRLEKVIVQFVEDRVVIVALRPAPSNGSYLVNAKVMISWSDCHYGGKRPWFLCPAWNDLPCERRVASLYLTKHGFICRHCAELGYKSDHAHWIERPREQAKKILRELGGTGSLTDGFPPRPKGMHFDIYHSSCVTVRNLLETYADRMEVPVMEDEEGGDVEEQTDPTEVAE